MLEEGEIELQADDVAAAIPEADIVVPPTNVSGGTRAPYFTSPEGNSTSKQTPTFRPKKEKKKSTQPEIQLNWKPGNTPIRSNDVQDLLLSILTPRQNPRWCSVRNANKIVLLAAHGIDTSLLEEMPHVAQTLRNIFGNPIDFQARNPTLVPAQTAHALLTLPSQKKRSRSDAALNGSNHRAAQQQDDNEEEEGQINGSAVTPASSAPQAKRMKLDVNEDVGGHHAPELLQPRHTGDDSSKEFKTPTTTTASRVTPLPPPSSYVLTLEELEELDYPLPLFDDDGKLLCPDGFIATASSTSSSTHDIVALDCEMCMTTVGSELTRVTIIDKTGVTLLDELVVPDNPIVDYVTKYSGITAEMLQGVETRLKDVQRKILDIVSAETLLVVHSGENDLKALKMVHSNVIDTVALFPHPQGPPRKSSLKILASRFLRRSIQRDQHNPVEDAKTAMDLALLKFSKGPIYGTGTTDRGIKLTGVISQHNHRCCVVDQGLSLPRFVDGNTSAVIAATDEEAIEKACREVKKQQLNFLWLQLGGLHNQYVKEIAQHEAATTMPPPGTSVHRTAAVDKLLKHLQSLYDAAPTGTLFIIVTGQGNTPYIKYLNDEQYRRSADDAHPWTMKDEEMKQQLSQRAVSALCYLKFKL